MKPKLGNIYWIQLQNHITHPYVVIGIKDNIVTLCKITTNQKKASLPGNVILEIGEGNLEKSSIVDVASVLEKDITELGEYIGTLSEQRVKQINDGIGLLKRTYFS